MKHYSRENIRYVMNIIYVNCFPHNFVACPITILKNISKEELSKLLNTTDEMSVKHASRNGSMK